MRPIDRRHGSRRRTILRAVLMALASLALAARPATAQLGTPQTDPAAERDRIATVVRRLFDGMRARDTAAMRTLLDSTAVMQGPGGMSRDLIARWLRGVAASPDSLTLDERIGPPVVHVDADLATVWVDYWLFIGPRFSHCGVDAFLLARRQDSWRITAIADTRRREGCPPPPAR